MRAEALRLHHATGDGPSCEACGEVAADPNFHLFFTVTPHHESDASYAHALELFLHFKREDIMKRVISEIFGTEPTQ